MSGVVSTTVDVLTSLFWLVVIAAVVIGVVVATNTRGK